MSRATSRNTECFIQVLSPQAAVNRLVNVQFMTDNSQGGSLIFGGLLDRCTPDPNAEISMKHI